MYAEAALPMGFLPLTTHCSLLTSVLDADHATRATSTTTQRTGHAVSHLSAALAVRQSQLTLARSE
jgi:hypothetical protein